MVSAGALLTAPPSSSAVASAAPHSPSPRRISATTTTVPSKWDPAIEPVAEAVERLRRLHFEHPVPVTFLDDAAFDASIRARYATLTKADRARLRAEMQDLRALGLVAGSFDLDAVYTDPDTSLVLAYYDPVAQSITVRGRVLDPAHRLTLAHELTHAIDDQRFDLNEVERAATSSGALVRDALVEGDAEHVADLYRLGMTNDERALLDAELDAQSASTATSEPGSSSSAATPEVLTVFTAAPYVLGPPMVETIVSTRAQRGLDAAFRSPPTTDEPAFDVLATARPHHVARVPAPRLLAGERRIGERDVLGPFALYTMLSSRIDPLTALDAMDGWAGDAKVSFRRHDTRCLRVAIAGHTAAQTRRILAALRAYAAAIPAASASVEDTSSTATLTACDPGERSTPAVPYAHRALRLLGLRNEVIAAALAGGTSIETARCASARITHDPVFAERVASETDPTEAESAALGDRFQALLTDCLAARASD